MTTANQRSVANPAKVNLAEKGGDDRTDDQTKKNRNIADKAAPELGDQQDGEQHKEGDAEIDRTPILRIADAPSCPVDANPDKRNSDNGDDRAGHDRRKQRQQPADKRRHQDCEYPGDDGRAVNAEQAERRIRSDRDHRSDRRKRHTHDDRQANAESPDADAL